MCGFCHAPEDAYDALLDDATLDRTGLCPEAEERLRMAAAPRPAWHPRLEHEWNEKTHAFILLREWGHCTRCESLTWRYGHEPKKLLVCAPCVAEIVNVHLTLHGHFLDESMSDEDEATLRATFPRANGPPMPLRYLRFSDYPVHDTSRLCTFPGSRYRSARPPCPIAELSPHVTPASTPAQSRRPPNAPPR